MRGGTPRFQSHNFPTGEGIDIFFCFSLVFKGAFCIAFVIGFQRELLFVSRRYGVDQLFFRELIDAQKRRMFTFGYRKSSDSRFVVAIAGCADLFWALRHQIPR